MKRIIQIIIKLQTAIEALSRENQERLDQQRQKHQSQIEELNDQIAQHKRMREQVSPYSQLFIANK